MIFATTLYKVLFKIIGVLMDFFEKMVVFDNFARTMETNIQNSVFDNGYITTLDTK